MCASRNAAQIPNRASALCRGHARGLTLVELLVSIVVILIVIGVLIPAVPPRHRNHRQLRDSTQIRSITQALAIWAETNQGSYPLPSRIDADNTTVAQLGVEKDITSNILSLLLYNSNISPELCVSPAEVASNVELKTDYQHAAPGAAVSPDRALWDPSFKGTPLDGDNHGASANNPTGTAHQSYAHMVVAGRRAATYWRNTYNATEPIWSNRGPAYTQDDSGAGPPLQGKPRWTLFPGLLGEQSNTLQIHGGRSTWEGNVGFNDGHVTFLTAPAPDTLSYARSADPKALRARDNLFINETDEHEGERLPWRAERGLNAYLRPMWRVNGTGDVGVWRD